jgi:flagellar hook-associated protein 2
MGTVGLSFGSPTSGAGFDVSTTVSEIVANLQNVETPWKTQLTSLESQDTVISSLGTLVSNLSNDISSLTDFNGILAEKEGSSSNTNVLELTSASASAVAGTHTVQVNSLASTSSGYLAEVANASDTISGAVTLQVGSSGKPQTINMTDVNTAEGGTTLADIASYINSSNVGIDASVLTDATGSRLSLVSATSGATGNVIVTANSLAAAASNTLAATVTAGTAGITSSATLSPVTSSTEPLTGTLTITAGSGAAQTIYLGNSTDSGAPAGALDTGTSTNTLSSLESFINANASALGLAGDNQGATIVTNSDGTASLELTSAAAGTTGTLAVSSSLVDSATALGYTSAVTGSNASLTVDGVNLTSASNTVTNLIPGVTFQLLATSSEPVQIVIGNDNSDVESTVSQFVSDYNSLVSAIGAQEGNTSSGTAEPLFGSPTLSLLQEQILGSINTQNPNGYLDTITNASDTLTGSMTIQVGSGTAKTIDVPSSNSTLAGLASSINSASIGVTATVVSSSSGSQLELLSQTEGASGTLTVTSNVTDSTTGTALNYTGSGSDINDLTSLGIGTNDDGTLTFDSSSLDAVLNTDYNSVVGFFQNANSWGQTFATMLNNAGTSSPTSILSLASSSNSSIESSLNAEISKENTMISAEQKSLTTELNSANEIMQQLPTELDGMNELYSAITGYGQSTNG